MSSFPDSLLDTISGVLESGLGEIKNLVQAGKDGKWSASDQAALLDLLQPILAAASDLTGFQTIGVLAGGEAGFIISVEEIAGLALDMTDLDHNPYFYEFTETSAGISEEITGMVGILLAKNSPEDLSGRHSFVNLEAGLDVGLSIKRSSDGQYMLMVLGGEDVDVSVGAGKVVITEL